ncbi:MAG: 16S rRNA (adenine(1518)-N(6)/adenine(1519)-N(6))-dimethyltransferase RsmA [Chloroflexota bacterium]|nr:16S rRNA (adenine(1518)-N(6)/adenine(1519)-N(6))-dimethyltransferase RsmA [Lentimicrobium sp.]
MKTDHPVRAKKHLGQHFLNDENIARKITDSVDIPCNALLEIGPGTGVLTKYLLLLLEESATNSENANVRLLNQFLTLDVDRDSIAYLKQMYPQYAGLFREADFLKFNPGDYFNGCFSVIGNFPYNISSQIFFKILDHTNQIPEVVCMLQKEVAERIAAPPGSKTYGILSVLLQAWYDIEYLFTVHEHVFIPPPKVKSAVIRLKRNTSTDLGCDPVLFKKVVKTAFNQRRKTLRNALKSLDLIPGNELEELLTKRAEQLSVNDFVFITGNLKKV